jgi:hypothetical protein
MDGGILARIVILVFLVLLAQFQLTLRQRLQTQPFSPTPVSRNATASADPVESAFDLSFPLINRSLPHGADLAWALQYLKIPTWSPGYFACDSAGSEVSCFELHRAAKTIDSWEKAVKYGRTTGQVWIQITNETFGDRLSMLYHGIQIGLATSRNVVTDHSLFKPLTLPASIGDVQTPQEGASLPTDYQFGCADLSPRFPKLQFSGASWPQVLYTHPLVAPYLRANFGYHAAHFIGNWLFGTDKKPSDCFLGAKQAVEGWKWPQDFDQLRISDYSQKVGRCGVRLEDAVLMSNDASVSEVRGFEKTVTFGDSNTDLVCALRKLTSSKRIIHTFGSRIGFWATAMLGTTGAFVNGIDRLCINLTNSQQGSLWHTYCPPEKLWLYRTNSRFYVCGPNVNDARLYIEYLLW